MYAHQKYNFMCETMSNASIALESIKAEGPERGYSLHSSGTFSYIASQGHF